MPRIRIDEEKLLPEGEYVVTVADVSDGRTKDGDDMWTVILEVAEGPYATGQVIEDRIVFSVAAMKRLRIIAKAFGLPLPIDNIEPSDILGKTVIVTTKHDEYKGETKSKVVFSGYRQAPVKPRDPIAEKFRSRAVGGFEPVREPGEDKAELPAHDANPFPGEDAPF